MRTAVTRALGGLVVVATLVSGLSACTGDDGSSTPTPEPSSEPTTSPTEPVDLTFGVFGSNEEIRRLHGHGQQLRHGRRPRRRDREGLAEARRPAALDRAGRAGARRVPRVAARPALVRRERPDRTRRHPARRARRRLRRRLLPRRARGVQQRQPPAVHAVRRLAAGGLLQQEHGRLRPDGDPRARRARPTTGGGASTSSRRRRSSRRVRAASTKGVAIDADPGRAGAVHLLRRWRRLRRRHRPDLARVQRREHAGRPRDDPRAAPRPQAHPVRGAARREVRRSSGSRRASSG